MKHLRRMVLVAALLGVGAAPALAAFAPFMVNRGAAGATPPTVVVTAPATNCGATSCSGTITVSATCTANCTDLKLQIAPAAGGTTTTILDCTMPTGNVASCSTTTYDTTTLSNGNYNITALGTNSAGPTTSSAVAIAVNNAAPGTTAILDAAQLGSTGNTLDTARTTATQGGGCGAQYCSVRTTIAASAGKYYWEMKDVVDANTGGNSNTVELRSGSVAMVNVNCAVSGCTTYRSNGQVFIAGVLGPTLQTWTPGSATIAVAVDLDANQIWFKVVGGNWNNSSTANPATGAGGISLTTPNAMTGSPWFVGSSLYGSPAGNQVTYDFGAVAYAATPPAGFNNWPWVNGPVVLPGASVTSAGGAAVALDPTLVVEDNQSTNLGSATVQITTGYTSGDTLACPGSCNGLTATYTAGATGGGLLTLNGTATVAAYQVALQSVTFSSTATSGSRTITWIVTEPTTAFVGAGDIPAAGTNAYAAYYGTRAYNAATRGSRLLNVCNSNIAAGTDSACADLVSSTTTGDLVPAPIGGVTCPGNANCTIQKVYDLTGKGNDLSLPTVSSRPLFTTSTINGHYCMVGGTGLLQSSTTPFTSFPMTLDWVGERTGNFNAYSRVFTDSGSHIAIGWNNVPNQAMVYSPVIVATAPASDGVVHAAQIFLGGPDNSVLRIDGVASPTSILPPMNGNLQLMYPPTTGFLCEAGLITADFTANAAAVTGNRQAWYNLPPTVSSILPSRVLPAGGTSVQISGTFFSNVTQVKFGSTPATSFTVNSNTLITAVAPAFTGSLPGTVDVTVATANGTSTAVAADQLTYQNPATYTGPGDIATNQVWYGTRAYSAATRGKALMNVCDSTGSVHTLSMGTGIGNNGSTQTFNVTAPTPILRGSVAVVYTYSGVVQVGYDDGYGRIVGNGIILSSYSPSKTSVVDYNSGSVQAVFGNNNNSAPDNGTAITVTYRDSSDIACADVFSDVITGDLVPILAGTNGFTIGCPDDFSRCTIKTAYDLTHPSNGGSGGGADVTQSTPINRPTLDKRSLPILGVERACMVYQDFTSSMQSTATVAWGPAPITISGVFMNQSSGSRWSNRSTNSVMLNRSGGAPSMSWTPPNGGDGLLQPGQTLHLNAGTDVGIFALDHYPHRLQWTIPSSGASSIVLDGNASTVSAGNTVSATANIINLGGNASAQYFEGVICEMGFATSDIGSTARASMDSNQSAYYFTPNVTYAQLFNHTTTFDESGVTTGGFTIAYLQQLFAVPMGWGTNPNYVNSFDDQAYVYSNGDGCMVLSTGKTSNGEPNSTCSPGLYQTIISATQSNGTTGQMLSFTTPAFTVGGSVTNYGFGPHLDVYLNNVNVIDLEWDDFFSSSYDFGGGNTSGANAVLAKFGQLCGFNNIEGFGGSSQPQGSSTQLLWYQHVPADNSGSISLQGNAALYVEIQGGTGNVSSTTWYHFHIQCANGPHGFINWFWGPSSGTVALNFAWSRGSTANGMGQLPYPMVSYAPSSGHYGGGSGSANGPGHNSSEYLDNMSFRGYNR